MKQKRLVSFVTACAAILSTAGSSMAVIAADDLQSVRMRVGAVTLDGQLPCDLHEIGMKTASLIDLGVVEQQYFNAKNADSSVTVQPRDWTIYDDEYGLGNMTYSQRVYYTKLETMAQKYINDPTLDAYYVSAYDTYVTSGVDFASYALTSDQAIAVTKWFIYNNPQYYFLKSQFLYSSDCVYVGCYNAFADGDDRARMTNEIFSVVDGWVASINDDEETIYDTVLSAHDLLCDEITYVSNDYDQSLYSAVILKQTVCAGYADAMTLLLNASGIPTTTVISENHAWNAVNFGGGRYYGVDATWDDSLGDHHLFAVGASDMTTYDSDVEHVAIYPWSEWAPALVPTTPLYYNGGSDTPVEVKLIAPENIQAAYEGQDVRLIWDAVSQASGYEVQLAGSTKVTSVTEPQVRLTNMQPGQEYTVRIRAVSDDSINVLYSDWSEYVVQIPAQVIETTVPVTTSTTKATTTTTKATTKATTSTTKATTTTTKVTTKATTSTTKATTTTTKATTKATTSTTKATTTELTDAQYTTAISLSKPVVTVSDVTSKTARVSWDAVPNALGYEYVFAYDANFTNVIADRYTVFRALSLSGLNSQKTYYVRVRAYTGYGNTIYYSDWSSVAVKPDGESKISAPVISGTRQMTTHFVKVTWLPCSDAKKYEIAVFSDAELTQCQYDRTTILTSATVSVDGGAPYYIAVRSLSDSNVNKAEYSDWTVLAVK